MKSANVTSDNATSPGTLLFSPPHEGPSMSPSTSYKTATPPKNTPPKSTRRKTELSESETNKVESTIVRSDTGTFTMDTPPVPVVVDEVSDRDRTNGDATPIGELTSRQ